jgi:hypothetical protein
VAADYVVAGVWPDGHLAVNSTDQCRGKGNATSVVTAPPSLHGSGARSPCDSDGNASTEIAKWGIAETSTKTVGGRGVLPGCMFGSDAFGILECSGAERSHAAVAWSRVVVRTADESRRRLACLWPARRRRRRRSARRWRRRTRRTTWPTTGLATGSADARGPTRLHATSW